jgi:hypothetical protein
MRMPGPLFCYNCRCCSESSGRPGYSMCTVYDAVAGVDATGCCSWQHWVCSQQLLVKCSGCSCHVQVQHGYGGKAEKAWQRHSSAVSLWPADVLHVGCCLLAE